MSLEPVRIAEELWYSCPRHAAILRQGPGQCPLDRQPLVPVVTTIHWVCDANASERMMEPGRCADGRDRRLVRLVRAHGDHNPRHGGIFYMASNQWHHVEGVYPRQGLVQVFVYDNFTQPVDATGVKGRLVLREEFDPASKMARELMSVPLVNGSERNVLEAVLTNDTLPLRVSLKIRLGDEPEQRMDFVFDRYSVQ